VKKTDPTTDFERALQESNVEEAPPESVGLPAIFPGSREKVEEREHEEVSKPEEEKVPHKKDYRAKYRRFDLSDPDDVAELEKVNNHIMNDGWLPGREEWIHTRDGGTYVVLKWLECDKVPKKRTAEQEEFDAVAKTLNEFGMAP